MAANIKVLASEHPIKSVTVFKSSKAEVVRTFSLDLKSGQNRIVITGLSSCLDTESVRVSGLGEARLFDVVCTIGDNKAAQQDRDSPSERIRILLVNHATLESEKRVRENESALLYTYANTLKGEHITPTQMTAFLESYIELGRKNQEALKEIGEKIVENDREIEKETARRELKKGESHGEVTVVVVADEDAHVELKLTYIVSNASWEPTYELHATTENGKPSSSVALHYRARITQSTGENWTDTALTLSTVSSEGAKSIPTLFSMTVRPQTSTQVNAMKAPSNNNFLPLRAQVNLFGQSQQASTGFGQTPTSGGLFGANTQLQQQQQPQQQPQQQGGFVAFGQPQQASALGGLFGSTSTQPSGTFGLFGSTHAPEVPALTTPEDPTDTFEEIVAPTSLAEPSTIVSESPLAISYSVESKSTIPSDGVAHQVSVAMLPFEAKVTYVTLPRAEAVVYLQCEVKNTSDYRLLPGPVTVILDDSYVSKTVIQDINKGDTFDCTLGADSAARVSYSRKSRTVRSSAGAFAEVSNTTTYNSTITVHNKHQFPITELIVKDIVPLSSDSRVKVILRKPKGLAEAKDGTLVDLQDGLKVGWEKLVDGKGGEKEGKFQWLWKVDAGAKVSLEAEWEIKATGDVAWVEAPYFGGRFGGQ